MNISRYKQNFEITSCLIRDKDNISFVCQKWDTDDPLVPHETAILTCNIKNPAKVIWNAFDIGTTTGLHGCPVYKPNEGWVFITDLSDVYVIGEKDSAWEEKVVPDSPLYTLKAKCIGKGLAYALGPNSVYYRRSASNWIKLENGLNNENLSFDDMDGFSENDIYACGGYGGLWRYDGTVWSNIQLPTNLRVKYLCCGGDGYVYIVTAARNSIVRGRGDVWDFIEKDELKKQMLGKIAWFADRLYLLTTQTIYEVSYASGFKPFDMGDCHIKKSFSQMAAEDGILVVTSSNQAAVYNGKNWNKVL